MKLVYGLSGALMLYLLVCITSCASCASVERTTRRGDARELLRELAYDNLAEERFNQIIRTLIGMGQGDIGNIGMWSVIANRTENQFQHRRVGLIAVFLHEYIAGMTITGVRSLFRSNFGLECSPLVAITTIRGHIPVEVSSDQSLYRFQVMGVPTYALTAYVSVSKTRPSQDVDQDLRGIGGGVVSKVFADCWATDLSGMRQ